MCAGGGGGNTWTPGPGHDPNAVPDQQQYSDHWNSETGSWNYETKPGYTRDDSRQESAPKSGHFDKDTGYVYEHKTGDFEADKLTFYKENVWNAPDTGGRSSGEMNV